MTKKMNLIMENWRNFISEQQTQSPDAALNSLLGDISSLGKQMNVQAAQQNAEDVKESAALLGLSIAMAVPKLLELAGKLAGKLNMKNAADWLQHSGHAIHAKYIQAINFVLKAVPQFRKADPQKQKQVSEMVFMGMVAIMMGVSGVGFAKQLAALTSIPVATAEGILTAVKAGEVAPFLVNQITAILK